MDKTFEKIDDNTLKIIETSETSVSIKELVSRRDSLLKAKETTEARLAEVNAQIAEAERLGIILPTNESVI